MKTAFKLFAMVALPVFSLGLFCLTVIFGLDRLVVGLWGAEYLYVVPLAYLCITVSAMYLFLGKHPRPLLYRWFDFVDRIIK